MKNQESNEAMPYNIKHWGEGYFSIDREGYIKVHKNAETKGLVLQAIINKAELAGASLPLLLRFPDILQDRVDKINIAFNEVIKEYQYQGNYQLAYPIKVNQEQQVVKALLSSPNYRIGLEAGSKPELMAVLGILNQGPATIICNGYKDASYIRTALIAQKMGHKVFIVIEKYSELDILIEESARLEITPNIGLRIRLSTKGAGKWADSGGSKSKFGLTNLQVLQIVNRLKEEQVLHYLQLMHFHLGSQIANIHDIRHCMQEVARYYIELCHLKAPIHTIDIGGGLAIDYEGTRSSTDCSMNYSLKEYATNIILAIKPLCEEANLPCPNLISESGRALTAHHAVLVTNITDIETQNIDNSLPFIEKADSYILHDIWDTHQCMETISPSEAYNYASHSLDEACSLFKHGVISLQEKTKVEQIFTAICLKVQEKFTENNLSDTPLAKQINERMAAKVFCNLSFFKSLPDAWAIKQIFPVAPLSQITTNPNMHSILQDLTCDSDGTIKEYSGLSSINTTLMLPPFNPQNPYTLGFFLVGAYQEILGNLHNLFGSTNIVEVKLSHQGDFEIAELIKGDSISDVLDYVHFPGEKLLQSYEKQLQSTTLSEETKQMYLNELQDRFFELTYLNPKKIRLTVERRAQEENLDFV